MDAPWQTGAVLSIRRNAVLHPGNIYSGSGQWWRQVFDVFPSRGFQLFNSTAIRGVDKTYNQLLQSKSKSSLKMCHWDVRKAAKASLAYQRCDWSVSLLLKDHSDEHCTVKCPPIDILLILWITLPAAWDFAETVCYQLSINWQSLETTAEFLQLSWFSITHCKIWDAGTALQFQLGSSFIMAAMYWLISEFIGFFGLRAIGWNICQITPVDI